MKDLQTLELPSFDIKAFLAKEKFELKDKQQEAQYKMMILNQQKILTLTSLLCSGVVCEMGNDLAHENTPRFIPALGNATDRGVVTKKILEIVGKF